MVALVARAVSCWLESWWRWSWSLAEAGAHLSPPAALCPTRCLSLSILPLASVSLLLSDAPRRRTASHTWSTGWSASLVHRRRLLVVPPALARAAGAASATAAAAGSGSWLARLAAGGASSRSPPWPNTSGSDMGSSPPTDGGRSSAWSALVCTSMSSAMSPAWRAGPPP